MEDLENQNRMDKEKIKELNKKLEEYENNEKEKEKNVDISNFDFNNKEDNKILQNILEQQSKDYNRELNKIKNEYINKLDNAKEKELVNNYSKILEDLENKRKNDFIEKVNNRQKKLNFTLNESIHEGFKCQICHKKPIIGIRYQCSKCPDYNLCENCEEEYSETSEHKYHHFIKIKYAKIDDKNINKKINEKEEIPKKENIEKIYSFEILDLKENNLVYVGTNKIRIKFSIKNNCKFEYPEGTLIKYSDSSILKPKAEINIKKLKPNEIQEVTFVYTNIKNCTNILYYTNFYVEINNKKICNDIMICIKFLETNNMELVKKFREIYNFYPIKKDDNYIVKALQTNGCDFEYTFNYILYQEEKKNHK